MNDYRYIRHAGAGYRKIRPYETVRVHQDQRNWFEDRLSRPHPGQTVVTRHHCLHPDLISGSPGVLDPVWEPDIAELIDQHQPYVWLFGPPHHHVETTEEGTPIRNVPLGYPDQVAPGSETAVLRRGLVNLTTKEHRRLVVDDLRTRS
jgi:hypothetical protein